VELLLKRIEKANRNLTLIYGDRHDKPITLECIEAAYGRNPLGIEVDAKTRKGSNEGFMTGIMYFASGKLSGIEVCAFKSPGCDESCLVFAGRGGMYPVTRARIIKTLAFFNDMVRYTVSIKKGIKSLITKAKNKNMTPVVRLNGTSDIQFWKITDIMQSFPEVQFYDYTKNPKNFNHGIANYHTTFSLAENNLLTALDILNNGNNVAVVFRDTLPMEFYGFKVIDGDKTDLRFLDPKGGYVVGLIAKGKAKKDKTGFVKDIVA
jgi:hypothetical protein